MMRRTLLLALFACSSLALPACSRKPEASSSAPQSQPSETPPASTKPPGPEAPPDVVHVADRTYRSLDDGTILKLDVVYPKSGDGPFPTVVILHGGGWFHGDYKFHLPLARKLAERGYVAVTVGYRLSRQARYPAAIEDVECAVRWLREHAKTYKIDPDRFAALGYSSGGHMACMLGNAPPEKDSTKPSCRVQAVVGYYAITDLAALHKSCTNGDLPAWESVLVRTALETFLGGPPGKTVDYVNASPITSVSKDAAPTLLIHGSADKKVPIAQSRRYEKKMRDAGATVELLVLEGAPHDFEKEPEIHANAVTFDFLDRQLKKAKPAELPKTK